MTASYASIAAKPKPGSFEEFASKAKNFTWSFSVDYFNPSSISVIAFTVDEARQQVLDTLAKIVPFATEKEERYKRVIALRKKIQANVQLGNYCTDILNYTEDLTVHDYNNKEIKLGELIRKTEPRIQPLHRITFYSCLDG
jgi:hypothetical protein